MLDYFDREIRHSVDAVLVNPFDLSNELGELRFDVGTVEIDRGYYTDNRVSAYLDTSAWDEYVPHAWIRLYHVAEKAGKVDRIERATLAVQDAIIQSGAGETVFSLSLMSAIGVLEHDYDAWAMTLGKGATASKAIDTICKKCGRAYTKASDFNDYRWTSASAMPAGESFRSRLYEICDKSKNRMSVDSHGRITFKQYTAPKSITPSMTLDVDDTRPVIVDGSISPGTNRFTRASRAVVVYKDGDKVVSAQADVASSNETSFGHRGFTIAELHELSDMPDPKTVAHAQEMAKTFLKDDSDPTTTWELETLWLPLDQGDVIRFAPRRYDPWGDGKARKCLVQAVEEETDRMRLTLKEV